MRSTLVRLFRDEDDPKWIVKWVVPSGNGNGKSAAVFADVFPWISIATLECRRVSQNWNPTALGTITHSGAKNFNE